MVSDFGFKVSYMFRYFTYKPVKVIILFWKKISNISILISESLKYYNLLYPKRLATLPKPNSTGNIVTCLVFFANMHFGDM